MSQSNFKSYIRHGNYHKYYEEFRTEDSRPEHLNQCLQRCWDQLPSSVTKPGTDLYLLDVGCNCGKLTKDVLKVIESRSVVCDRNKVCMLGIDIDEALTGKASKDYGSDLLSFTAADISSLVLNESATENNPLHSYLLEHHVERFDFIFCFSVLMYVHLNHGDEGLRKVLKYLCHRAQVLVLELQGWHKYRDHKRRMLREGDGQYEQFEKLEWRGAGVLESKISEFVVGQGFRIASDDKQINEFGRNILIFARNDS
ncbi:probable RNA methyltransferase CG11342 [Uranotaenia lowii]|uniref:probable RNA methyltransferase CG11342 n=1 Tax=Uranotaenia lowii TaxID=190385 RepID=UPI002479F6AB|nr:probable RNA methyltransferase CG11342 [Uranotaenia lowii]